MRKLDSSETTLIKEYVANATELESLESRQNFLNGEQRKLESKMVRAFRDTDFVTISGDKAIRIVIEENQLTSIEVFNYRVSE